MTMLHSPAAERNKAPILQALQALLPPQGRMLELAAGSGQHAQHLASHLPGWAWLATDPDPAAVASVNAHRAQALCPGLLPAQRLDVRDEPWPLAWPPGWPLPQPLDAVYCANMLHIAPWACCGALMRGAARWLAPQGRLVTYGPYFVQGEDPSPGNTAFDADLRARDPAWGLRWLHDVQAEGLAAGLVLQHRRPMPANNLLLVFGRAAADQPAA